VKKAQRGKIAKAVTAPIRQRKPRIFFCSSFKESRTRQRAETNARGPPKSSRITMRTMIER